MVDLMQMRDQARPPQVHVELLTYLLLRTLTGLPYYRDFVSQALQPRVNA